MALRKMIPSFNIGGGKQQTSTTTAIGLKNEAGTTRVALRAIGNANADDAKRTLKAALKEPKPSVMSSFASGLNKPKDTKLAVVEQQHTHSSQDIRQMDVDAPKLTWPAPPAGVEDIDEEDAENPLLVAEYVNDIYAYLRDLEVRHAVPANYLSISQKDTQINEKMRSILVDWLVEVHLRFKLLQETLFMTIDILDRFLALHPTPRNKLQLVGITSMLIASKYEEMYPPEVRDFVYIADNAYTRAEIFAMEALILRKLDFNLGTPLPLHFLRRFSRACHADSAVHTLSKYFMELKMLSYGMVKYHASETAAAAVCIARRVCDPDAAWTPTLVHYSGYSEAALEPVVAALNAELLHQTDATSLPAIRRKYANVKLMRASEMPELTQYVSTLST